MAPHLSLTDLAVSIVKPLQKTTHTETIYPSFQDLNADVVDSYQQTIFLYRLEENSQEEYLRFLNQIKEGLQAILIPFFPFAGRWFPDEQHGRRLFCNDAGVPFLEAFASQDLDSVVRPSAEFQFVPELTRSDFVGLDSKRFRQRMLPDGLPPVFVQVTRFMCGSIALGVSFNHMHCDGSSFFDFMFSWSEIARTKKTTIKPSFDRSLVTGIEDALTKLNAGKSPREGIVDNLLNKKEVPSSMETHTWVMKIYEVRSSVIEVMKNEAKKTSNGPYVSTVDCIFAHFWKYLVPLRSVLYQDDQKDIRVGSVIDGRERFYVDPLPHLCGNVTTILMSPRLSMEEVVNKPVYSLAQSSREKLLTMKRGHWFSTERVMELMQAAGDSNRLFANTSFFRFPMYDLNFGVGGSPFFSPGFNAGFDPGGNCLGFMIICPPIPGHHTSAALVNLICEPEVKNALESIPDFLTFFLDHGPHQDKDLS